LCSRSSAEAGKNCKREDGERKARNNEESELHYGEGNKLGKCTLVKLLCTYPCNQSSSNPLHPSPFFATERQGQQILEQPQISLPISSIIELKRTLKGNNADESTLIFAVILRAGFALLPEALEAYPDAKVAVLGLRRNERTKKAYWYYENTPKITSKDTIAILDPMLATGGSAVQAVRRLLDLGGNAKKIYFVGVIAAPEGLDRLTRLIPQENLILAAVDNGLDAKKFIVPGLGDFGDRYFGYKEGV
jgi:uracil phosphoribosyltransferase